MFLISLLAILPIWFSGLVITRIISSEKRLEVLLPVSLFGGICLFTFLLNILSYIFPPPQGIYIIYALFALLALILWHFQQPKVDMPRGTSLILYILSTAVWGILLFKIIGHMNLTGDPFIYQTIGKSFTRGNFPIYESWEPDIKLSYHYGPSIFLGVFHKLFNLPFDLVQRSTSFITTLMLSQFLIWIFKRHLSLKSLLIYQLIPLIALICLGNWIIALPMFPLTRPSNFPGLIAWLSGLPTAHMNISTYGGATVALDGLMYFYHELIGMASFIWIVWLTFTYRQDRRLFSFFFLAVSIAATIIINEVFFPISILSVGLIIFFKEFQNKFNFSRKNILVLFTLFTLFCLTVIFQGGVLTESLFGKKSEYPTIQLFPDKKNIMMLIDKSIPLADYTKQMISLEDYQKIQQSSLLYPPNERWLPFRWFHPSFIFFYLANLVICLILYIYKQKNRFLLCLTLLLSAAFATLIYNSTYIIGNNSSRLIAFAYTFLGTNLVLSLIWLLEFLKRVNNFYLFLVLILIAWLSIPSILPSLVQQLTPKESQNKFFSQESDNLPPTLNWMYNNLPYNSRIVNVVAGNYNGATLSKVGIFTPTWTGKYRAYTMDGSPDYFDLIYTLNPSVVKKFKITYLVIDSTSFAKLPLVRQQQLSSLSYFPPVYGYSLGNIWERIYRITDKYLLESEDLPGTFQELNQKIPNTVKIYIDKESPPSKGDLGLWASLRRALIFTLKDRDLYYEYGLSSGNNLPYQHVEARVSGNPPSPSINYDYLALYSETQSKSVCHCQAKIIWRGFEDNIVIWQVLK